jgi:hypothetical protein
MIGLEICMPPRGIWIVDNGLSPFEIARPVIFDSLFPTEVGVY